MEGKEEKMTESKETTKVRNDYPLDVMVSILLALVLIALIAKPLADAGVMNYWWGFFIICNICYIAHGLKKGFVKSDPVNALVIVAGPIPFYFWTMIGAWRKYGWKAKKHE